MRLQVHYGNGALIGSAGAFGEGYEIGCATGACTPFGYNHPFYSHAGDCDNNGIGFGGGEDTNRASFVGKGYGCTLECDQDGRGEG